MFQGLIQVKRQKLVRERSLHRTLFLAPLIVEVDLYNCSVIVQIQMGFCWVCIKVFKIKADSLISAFDISPLQEWK